MSIESNVRELELKLKMKAFLTYHGDGLIDILMGWNLIGIGVFLYTHSIVYSWIGLFPLFFYKPLKSRITLPRLGHAKFRTRRTPLMWTIGGIGVVLILVAIVFGFFLKDSFGLVGPIALTIFGIAFVFALTSGFNRIFAYAVLIPLFFVVGLGLGFLSPIMTMIIGAFILLIGSGMLVRFIRTHPVLEFEDPYAAEAP
jgi:hypothetical protein